MRISDWSSDVCSSDLCPASPSSMKRGVKKALLLLLLLGGCVSAESWEATRLLQDIDAAGGPSALKERAPEPQRTTERYSIDGRANVADVYHPNQPLGGARSEEHTSELQSLMRISYAVFC